MIGLWVALVGVALAERPITYEEALRSSVERNADLASALASRDQAVGQLLAARGQFDPRYTLSGGWSTRSFKGFLPGSIPFEQESETWDFTNSVGGSTGTGTSYGLNLGLEYDFQRNIIGGAAQENVQSPHVGTLNASVTQSLLRGLMFGYNVQTVTSARTGLELADLELEKQKQETLYRAAEAYWGWVYQTELQSIALDSVAVAEEALRVGRLQVDSGQLAPVEATRLEAAMVQAQQNALDASNAAERAANVMLLSMAIDPSEPVVPATEPGDVPASMDLDPAAAVAVAQAQNLDLLVARRNRDQSTIDVANARHGMLPELSTTVRAGVRSQRDTPAQALGGLTADDNQPFVELRGEFSVPIGNRSARGDLGRLKGVRWQREQALLALERQIGAQVEEQVRTLQSARQQTDLADANQRLAEETLAAEEALAAAGRTLQKDVLEARTEVARTRAEAAKARTDYRLAQALLLKLQGQLTEAIP